MTHARILRTDLVPGARKTPRKLTALLARLGGVNPYDEPLFRLIRAEDRVTLAAGEWNIWPDDATIEDRSGLAIQTVQQLLAMRQETLLEMQRRNFLPSEIKKAAERMDRQVDDIITAELKKVPLRVDVGQQLVPLYNLEGWILEKWRPASTFGSPEEWNRYQFAGVAALGPYPYQGDYEMIAGPTPHMPSELQLEEAVREHMKELHDQPSSARERALLQMQAMERRKQEIASDRRNQIESIVKDGPASLHDRVSLGAGRVIKELAEKAGLKGHYGN